MVKLVLRLPMMRVRVLAATMLTDKVADVAQHDDDLMSIVRVSS